MNYTITFSFAYNYEVILQTHALIEFFAEIFLEQKKLIVGRSIK